MLHVAVFLTFFGTYIADLRTSLTKELGMCPAHAHELGRSATYQGTLPVQLYATGQSFNIVFVKALGGAVLTFGGACLACFNTALEFFVTHGFRIYV